MAANLVSSHSIHLEVVANFSSLSSAAVVNDVVAAHVVCDVLMLQC